jgi:hypothetical protein
MRRRRCSPGCWNNRDHPADQDGPARADRRHPGPRAGALPGGTGRTAGAVRRRARDAGDPVPRPGRARRRPAALGRLAGLRPAGRAGRARLAPGRSGLAVRRQGRRVRVTARRAAGPLPERADDLGRSERQPGRAQDPGRGRPVPRLGHRPRGPGVRARHRGGRRHGAADRAGSCRRRRPGRRFPPPRQPPPVTFATRTTRPWSLPRQRGAMCDKAEAFVR